ncbi:MAG: hypothetical protein AAFR76_03560 [Planctomycetota bacterium]
MFGEGTDLEQSGFGLRDGLAALGEHMNRTGPCVYNVHFDIQQGAIIGALVDDERMTNGRSWMRSDVSTAAIMVEGSFDAEALFTDEMRDAPFYVTIKVCDWARDEGVGIQECTDEPMRLGDALKLLSFLHNDRKVDPSEVNELPAFGVLLDGELEMITLNPERDFGVEIDISRHPYKESWTLASAREGDGSSTKAVEHDGLLALPPSSRSVQ